MALVIPKTMLGEYLDNKIFLADRKTAEISFGGKLMMTHHEYPVQDGAAAGCELVMVEKNFCDYAATKGGKGAMTAAQIKSDMPEISDRLADKLASDFGIYYDNYQVIPDVVVIAITTPFVDIFEICREETTTIE